jgi:hypothetical protein
MFNNNLLMGAAAATSGTSLVSVGNSALFNGTNYLSRTPTTTGVEEKGTLSRWIYRTTPGNQDSVFAAYISATQLFQIYFPTDNTLHVYNYSGGYDWQLATTQVFRDIGWYHIVVAIDTTQAVASNRAIIYINGKRVTALATASYPSLNFVNDFNTSGVVNNLGPYDGATGSGGLEGYAAETVWIDGLQLTPTSFGTYDSSGLYWTPLPSATIQALTFGTNGFYLANKVTNQPQLDFQAGDDNSLANSQISALLHMDGSNDATSTTDSSSYGNAVTFAGNAHLDTSVKKYGTASLQLDGNGDYVTMADNDLFDFGTGDFTIRFSIYFTTIHSITAAYTNLMMSRITSGGAGFVISYKNGTNLYLMVNGTAIDQAYTLSTGQWYQMEISREGSTCRWFVDGTQRGTGTQAGNADQSEALAIGASAHAGYRASDRDIAGYMDEIEIIKGAAMHDSNFTAPSAAYSDPPTANNFTNNGTVTTNVHTPTNMYALLNPLMSGSTGTFSEGNRRATVPPVNTPVISTIPVGGAGVSGKWYCEVQFNTIHGYAVAGVSAMDVVNWLTDAGVYYSATPEFDANGSTFTKGTVSGTPITISASTTYGVMWDGDNSILKITDGTNTYQCAYTINDTSVPIGFIFAISSTSVTGDVSVNFGSPPFSISSGNADANGYGDFEFAVPSGYLALNTANIASETTRTASDVTKYFQTVLYEGNGVGQRVGAFQPFTDSFTIAKSALFNVANEEYFSRTFATPTDQDVWTLSWWMKTGYITTAPRGIMGGAASNSSLIYVTTANIYIYFNGGAGFTFDVDDPSQWQNIILTCSGTTLTCYWNGVSQGTASVTMGDFNSAVAHTIGSYNGDANWFDGYMADFVFVDGTVHSTSVFGQTDTSTNRWVPKDPTTTLDEASDFGNNGFFLNFADSSDMGNDISGNNHDWTNNNTVTQTTDSPTTNYATLNPSNKAATVALSIGNTVMTTGVASIYNAVGTIPMTTGKYYFEVETVSSDATYPVIGVASAAANVTGNNELGDAAVGGIGYRASGAVTQGGSTIQSYASWSSATNVAGCAYDADTGLVWFRASAGWNGDPAAGTGAAGWLNPTDGAALFGVSGYSGAKPKAIFREADWTYSAPTGFVALSQDNMTDTDQFISAFSWIKNRDATDNHMLFDRVRGIYNDWHWNDTAIQVTNTDTVQRFLSAGVQVGNDVEVNTANESYVLWNWMMEATGSGSSNTDGTINTISTLVDTTLGMSISTYTGTGNTATVGHGLGVTPDFVVIKVIDTAAQGGYGSFPKTMTENYNLYINGNGAQDAGDAFDTSENSSTVVGLTGASNGTNGSGRKYVMYAFATSQFISIGSYEGNGNANGTFCPTLNSLGVPIQPVWVLLKSIDHTQSWWIRDTVRSPYNVINRELYPDLNNAGASSNAMDIVTGGIKQRVSSDSNSSYTYVYMAIGTPIIDTDGRIVGGY